MSMPSAAPPPQNFEEASEAYVNSLIVGAQWYTTLGCQVLPIAIGKKVPAGGMAWNAPGNELIAANPEDALRLWAGKFRGCGIGMFCSWESRTIILDIDVKNGAQGQKSLMAHQAKFGALPPTMKNNSPSGGYHLIYRIPEEWLPAKDHAARGSVSGMDILFARRQAVMAPTRVPEGPAYHLDYIDPERRIPQHITTLDPLEMDTILYGKVLETDAERTTDWSQAHRGTYDGNTAERNSLADKLIDALSQYPSDAFGKSIVEIDCRKMRETNSGGRYNRLKELAMHMVLACVNDGAVIKLDDAMNDLMDAYRDAQLTTGEWNELEARNAQDTMQWAITRPSVIASLMSLDSMREWAGAMTMPADVARDAQSAVSASSYREQMRRKLESER